MFDFLKKKKTDTATDAPLTDASSQSSKQSDADEASSAGFFNRLKQGLTKTRASFTTGLANLFLGKKTLDVDLLNEIETLLLTADIGVDTTEQLINSLTQKLARKELNDT